MEWMTMSSGAAFCGLQEQGAWDGHLHQIAGVLVPVVADCPLQSHRRLDSAGLDFREVAPVKAGGAHQAVRPDGQAQGIGIQRIGTAVGEIQLHRIPVG